MNTTNPSSPVAPSLEIPEAYPVRFKPRLAQIASGGAILVALGAITWLWPILAAGPSGQSLTQDGLWSLVANSVDAWMR